MSIYARRRVADSIATKLCLAAAVFGLAWLVAILAVLIYEGVKGLSPAVFTQMTPAPGSSGGLLNAIFGSLLMTVLGVVVGAPLGLLAGTWLAEYGNNSKLATVIRFINDILLSAPSIVIGLFVYEVIVARQKHFSAWSGAAALAILVIPVVLRTTEDMLRLVPGSLREAATALGLPRSYVVRRVSYRAAKAGLVTGVLLAVARVLGRDGPAALHRAQQSIFQRRRQRADGEPAGRHLPVCALAIQGLAAAGVDGRASHHRRRAVPVDRRARARRAEYKGMNVASIVNAELPTKLSVQDLDFFYGDHHALKNISMPLRTNRVTAFIGPSGCGKSTLLRVLNRMYDLYPHQRAEGEVLLDGENILDPRVDVNLLRSRVGMVFQKPTPFPMTIYENIAFGVRLYEKLSRSELDGRVELALRGAALWNEVKDKLQSSGLGLSGGQQQRLCIARSVAVQPDVILFDEPCSALDPISTAKIEELMDELATQYTIAIVTHNMQQAVRVSDYTAFMYLGELIEFAETDAVFTTPKEKRTQDYITGRFG